MIYKLLITFILLGLVPNSAAAELAGETGSDSPPPLMISQIQVSGPAGADDEFIELKNISETDVSLDGWSIQYKSSTASYPVSSKKNLPDVLLSSGKHYLISRAEYSGTVTSDLTHSAFSLSGSAAGAVVYLSKSTTAISGPDDENIIDVIYYGTGHQSVLSALLPEAGQSVNVAFVDGVKAYQLKESEPKNLAFVDGPEPDVDPDPDSDPDPEPDQDDQSSSDDQTQNEEDDAPANEDTDNSDPDAYSSAIIISEILPNPTGADQSHEWIELYNSGAEIVNLKDWIIDDEGSENSPPATTAYKLSEQHINPGEYMKILIPSGKFTLNNSSGDSVRLFWPDLNLSTKVAYTETARENQTWCRLNSAYAWCAPTPNLANEPLPDPESPEDEEEEEQEEVIDYSSSDIRIISLLANPIGTDSGSEMITLFNQGASEVNLENWILDDGLIDDPIGSTAYVLPNQVLEVGEEAELILPKGKMSLNNTGEEGVRIFSPDKKLRDYVVFEKQKEGVVYGKVAGVWTFIDDKVETQIEAVKATDKKTAIQSAKNLPATGLTFSLNGGFFFVISLAIWYIVSRVNFKQKGIYEQTRSD